MAKPDLRLGETFSVRVRAVDQAGNAGDWLEYEPRVTIPGTPTESTAKNSSGCSSAGGASLGWLLLPSMLAFRRRHAVGETDHPSA